ncbi:hypothetical protein ABBQ38_004080 [Trebouxia sp. C0009 RCD-2024]
MDIVCQLPELPHLESSCSPENADAYAEPTRWQRLRAVAQTRSLLPADAAIKALAVEEGPYALHVASSPLSHFDSLPYQDIGILSRPTQIESARARVLLQSQHVSGVTDSLDADLQVEAVLRKAANQAACLAGLPRAPPRRSKVLAGLPLQSHSPTSMPPVDQKSQLVGGNRRQAAATADHARRQRIMQALQMHRLKQLAGCFEAWSAEAKQGQVHLRGAGSMLRWRKLLRIWKAWRTVTATSCAVRMAQQHARQAHLQDIAVTFHDLFRRHSILQAWHSTAQHAKRQRLQLQQQAGEQQQEATNQAAASRFHALYVKHSSWQRWVEVVQHSKVTRELDLQHQARQQSIQRFEAALKQHKQTQQSNSDPASTTAAEQAAAGHLQRHLCRTHLPAIRHHPRMRQLQQHRCHTEPDDSTARVDCTANRSVHPATANQGQDADTATDASHGPAHASEVSILCPEKASNSTSGSAKHQSQAVSAGLVAGEAAQAAVSAAVQEVATSQTGAEGGCQQRDKPTQSSAACLQHNRPSSLVVSEARAEAEPAGSGTGQQHAPPSTPGADQGPLQEQPCTPGLVSSTSACCVLPRSCSSNGGDSCGSGLEAENSIRFRKRSKFEALKARREEARQKAEAKQREQAEFEQRAARIRRLEARRKQEEEAAVKALGQQLLAQQNALARFQYARTVARNTGLHPWRRLVQLAHSSSRRAEQWASNVATQTAFRAWTAYLVEVKQQRAGQEADQQQLAEQHHRQVLIRGLWEGLGQALALRRTAQHDAHRHYQLCRQRLVSVKTEAHIQPLARRPGIFPPSRSLQVLRHWRAVQKDAADACLLQELQHLHQASLHQRRMFGLRSLHGWAEAAAASREEAAAQARKDATWDKIQQWLAEDAGRDTSSQAILAPPFLQDISGPAPASDPLLASLERALMTDPC